MSGVESFGFDPVEEECISVRALLIHNSIYSSHPITSSRFDRHLFSCFNRQCLENRFLLLWLWLWKRKKTIESSSPFRLKKMIIRLNRKLLFRLFPMFFSSICNGYFTCLKDFPRAVCVEINVWLGASLSELSIWSGSFSSFQLFRSNLDQSVSRSADKSADQTEGFWMEGAALSSFVLLLHSVDSVAHFELTDVPLQLHPPGTIENFIHSV